MSREVRYVDVPEAAARAAMEKTGRPEIIVDRLMSPSAIVQAGHASRVSEDVALLPGHAPPRFVDFVRRNVTAWR